MHFSRCREQSSSIFLKTLSNITPILELGQSISLFVYSFFIEGKIQLQWQALLSKQALIHIYNTISLHAQCTWLVQNVLSECRYITLLWFRERILQGIDCLVSSHSSFLFHLYFHSWVVCIVDICKFYNICIASILSIVFIGV